MQTVISIYLTALTTTVFMADDEQKSKDCADGQQRLLDSADNNNIFGG